MEGVLYQMLELVTSIMKHPVYNERVETIRRSKALVIKSVSRVCIDIVDYKSANTVLTLTGAIQCLTTIDKLLQFNPSKSNTTNFVENFEATLPFSTDCILTQLYLKASASSTETYSSMACGNKWLLRIFLWRQWVLDEIFLFDTPSIQ